MFFQPGVTHGDFRCVSSVGVVLGFGVELVARLQNGKLYGIRVKDAEAVAQRVTRNAPCAVRRTAEAPKRVRGRVVASLALGLRLKPIRSDTQLSCAKFLGEKRDKGGEFARCTLASRFDQGWVVACLLLCLLERWFPLVSLYQHFTPGISEQAVCSFSV